MVIYGVLSLTQNEGNRIEYLLNVLFLIISIPYLHRKQVFIAKPSLYYLLLFVILFYTTFFNYTLYDGVTYHKIFVSIPVTFIWFAVYFIIQAQIKDHNDFTIVVKLLNILGYIVSASVIISFFLFKLIGFSFGEVVQVGVTRFFGPLGDPVGWIIVYFILDSFVKKKKVGLVIHSFALLLTGTRGAIISALVGILWVYAFYFFFIDKKLKGMFALKGLLKSGLVLAVIMVLLLATIVGKEALSRFTNPELYHSGYTQRTSAAEMGLVVFADNPVTGVGFGGFKDLAFKYKFYNLFGTAEGVERGFFSTNNQLIQIATDAGVIGLTIFLSWLVSLFRNLGATIKYATNNDAIQLLIFQCFLIAIIVGNQTAVWFYNLMSAGYFIVLIFGIGEAYHRIIVKEPKQAVDKSFLG